MVCSAIDASAIPAGNTVSSVNITTAITHTWVGDLTAKLISPNGSSLTVLNRPAFVEPADDGTGCCGDSSDLLSANPISFLDGAAATAESMGGTLTAAQVICLNDSICSFSPSPGVSASLANFAGFAGGNASGTWNLCIGDSGSGDTGQLSSWSITITHQ
jgi:subtilisin-like proprotein convertase family protein